MTLCSNTQQMAEIMKRFIVAGAIGAFSAISAQAGNAVQPASPVGEWLVHDGDAHIRIVPCGTSLWGILSWEKAPGGKDENNPDPTKRNRPLLGAPILIDMKPGKGRWDGQVYNAENGSMYTSHISLAGDNVLKIEGCVLGGIFCGGEDWTRVPVSADKSAATPQQICAKVVGK